VLVNAQLLAEGWNSPRATVCMHLAPTASKRIYQQRVGRVTRRHPGKESGIVVDFVHPATKHDDPVVTLHSLLDRDVYRGGAIVVGPVRRGRGRRLRVERRVLPVCADENRRIEVFERELWRIAVEHLDYGEQIQWAALAGARVAPTGWRRARAMLHFDSQGELKRTFLLTALHRNKNPQLRVRALQEIAAAKDDEAFDVAVETVGGWPREEKREGVKILLLALAERKLGRRDQANNWIWHCAEYTREMHEEYAVQRWPETKRLLGLLVNSSGGAHARNARRLVHAARSRTAASPPPCSPPRRGTRTPPRPRRSCAAPARGCRASRPRCRASCCATSPRAAAVAAAGARRRAPRTPSASSPVRTGAALAAADALDDDDVSTTTHRRRAAREGAPSASRTRPTWARRRPSRTTRPSAPTTTRIRSTRSRSRTSPAEAPRSRSRRRKPRRRGAGARPGARHRRRDLSAERAELERRAPASAPSEVRGRRGRRAGRRRRRGRHAPKPRARAAASRAPGAVAEEAAAAVEAAASAVLAAKANGAADTGPIDAADVAAAAANGDAETPKPKPRRRRRATPAATSRRGGERESAA
jgi:hypothetical protein